MSSYDGYSDSCGGYGQGCSISGGYGCQPDYKACSPDYSPVTVNNSTCPNVEGSTSAGGTSYGNNSTVSVNMCGGGCGNDITDCCREGVKKLLCFLSQQALDPLATTATAYIYGDILDADLFSGTNSLITLANKTTIGNICVSDQIVTTNAGEVVSLCSVSIVAFTNSLTTFKQSIKETFKYVGKCSCSCECGNAIAEALCVYGLGRTYTVVIQDALVAGSVALATLTGLILVAVDNNIAIFSDNLTAPTKYYGIPTCRIEKFIRTA